MTPVNTFFGQVGLFVPDGRPDCPWYLTFRILANFQYSKLCLRYSCKAKNSVKYLNTYLLSRQPDGIIYRNFTDWMREKFNVDKLTCQYPGHFKDNQIFC